MVTHIPDELYLTVHVLYLSYGNSYSRQAILTVHVLYLSYGNSYSRQAVFDCTCFILQNKSIYLSLLTEKTG